MDTLKLLSKEFDVSINTLLGEPRKLICQCCGMPIDDDSILGRDKDGTLNEAYCKWCYADGTYTYNDMDEINEHVDNVCAFIKPGEVVLAWTDDESDPQYTMSQEDLKVLEQETDAKGSSVCIKC